MASESKHGGAGGDSGPWLHAWYDPVANLHAFSRCCRFTNLHGDGENVLVVASMDRKLRVYSGTSVASEHTLLDLPVALCSFYTDLSAPRMPALAVASGPYVFIYRNLRPYFKFTLPELEVDSQERDTWADLNSGKIDADGAAEALAALRDSGVALTSASLDLVGAEEPEARIEAAAKHKGKRLMQQTVITCMETLNKCVEGADEISSLVIGTEARQVLILDPPGNSIRVKCTLPAVPVFMGITGLFDVEYRIVVACRDGAVYTIKNGEVTGTVIELQSHPVGLVRAQKSILIGTMDDTIHCYHIKGTKNYSLYMPCRITNMELLQQKKTRMVHCLMVALENGEIRVYNGKALACTINAGGRITALRFGAYGREENSLIYLKSDGSVTIKMLRRSANLEVAASKPGPPPEQDVPLNVPRKTRLYVEQTQRERDQATDMHRIFQRELCKLRLETARSYVRIITGGQGPQSYAAGVSLRLNAQVQGLGPTFKVTLNLQNTGTRSLINVPMTFNYNHDLYRVSTPVIVVPLMIPALLYRYEVDVTCIDEAGGADVIKVFVCNGKSTVPAISAYVNMPMSEPLVAD
mmetsp:Transcript_7059/g.25118  ORF Transcript_7059/g.25118 Transcript_7059/m.25118 type:complete len:582 (-) Transcript_7059:34-1779(-)